MVSTHHAESDDSRSDRLGRHQLPARAVALQAPTIVSRSRSDKDGWTGKDRHSRAARSVCGRSQTWPKEGSRWMGTG